MWNERLSEKIHCGRKREMLVEVLLKRCFLNILLEIGVV